MGELPPTGWRDFATKRDIDAQRTELRGEMTTLRADLRGEMTELRADLRGEVTELRAELRGEMAELRGEFKRDIASFAHTVIYTNIGCMLGFGGIVLAAVKLA